MALGNRLFGVQEDYGCRNLSSFSAKKGVQENSMDNSLSLTESAFASVVLELSEDALRLISGYMPTSGSDLSRSFLYIYAMSWKGGPPAIRVMSA